MTSTHHCASSKRTFAAAKRNSPEEFFDDHINRVTHESSILISTFVTHSSSSSHECYNVID